MTRARSLVIFLLLACTGSAFQSPLSGRVQNSVTGEPISGASIELGCTNPNCTSGNRTQTNAEGLFSFASVPPGSYILIPFAQQFSNLGKSTKVIVEPGHEVGFLTLTLNPDSSLSGKVLDNAATPHANVTITAWRINRAGGHSILYQVATTQTDQKGRYTLTNLGKGSYYVAAELPRQSNISRRNFIFYPAAFSVDQATPLRVDVGNSPDGIDFKIPAVETHRISGRVSGLQDFDDPKTIELTMEPLSTIRAPALFQKIELQPDGTFFQDAVLPGSYLIRLRSSISAPAADGKDESFTVHQLATFNLDVGHTNVTGIDVAVVPPVHLSGRVVAPQIADLSQVKVTLRPAAFEASSEIKRATVSRDGTITFPTCDAARYAVQVAPPPDSYVSAIEFNRQDAVSHLVDMTSGNGGELIVKVASGSAGVSGNIHADSSEKPPPNAAQRVMLIPDNWNPEMNTRVPSLLSQDGTYSIKRQAPGRYRLIAVEWSDSTWRLRDEPELIRFLQASGMAVELTAGARLRIDVPLLPDAEVMQAAIRLGLN